jgi:hypothetical protein
MTKHYVSFTSIIIGLGDGIITYGELEQPDVILAFGCSPEHPFRTNGIPMEASWVKGCERQFTEVCDKSLLTPHAIENWENFLGVLEWADREGRIQYRIGNYYDYAMKQRMLGNQVWYNQTWSDSYFESMSPKDKEAYLSGLLLDDE